MAANVEVKEDDAGSIKPVKPSTDNRKSKIDGIVATIMALGRDMQHTTEKSVYSAHRGLRSL